MAKFNVQGSSDFEMRLSRLADPEVSKRVVNAGAQPVADEIRKGLETNIRDLESVSKNPSNETALFKTGLSSGNLLDALGIAPSDIDYDGCTNTKVGFDGYDEKGVPNQLKARVMESGSSRIRKRPFIRPAIKRSQNRAIEAMKDQFKKETENS